jgi:agmatine deiminase
VSTIFLADTLPKAYPAVHQTLTAALAGAGCRVQSLPNTRDVWVRDFMPVPRPGGGWVQFRYAPSYLRTPRERRTITDTAPICAALGLVAQPSPLVVDGGNVVVVGNMALVTDRVFSENAEVPAAEVRRQLQEVLAVEKLVVIPAHAQDFTGHADGMVQPVDARTVLVSGYRREKPAFVTAFRAALQSAGLECLELPYNPYRNRTYTDASGEYVNSLQVASAVLVPVFGLPEDEAALRVYEQAFPEKRIIGIRAEEVARQGGALHCISWTNTIAY